MGWRDEITPVTPAPAVCVGGKCHCWPACKTQLARVDAFLETHGRGRAPKVECAAIAEQAPPVGHAWFCAGCTKIQPGPGVHCDARVTLIEAGNIDRDAKTGRITGVRSAQPRSYFRWWVTA